MRLKKPTWVLSTISIYENTAVFNLGWNCFGFSVKIKCKIFFLIKNKRSKLDPNFPFIPI